MSSLDVLPVPHQRPDTWAAANAHCRVRYQVVADAQPALLCQVLNLLAMQYLVPCEMDMQRHDTHLHIEIVVDGLSWHRAEVIGEKMRNLIDVDTVGLQAQDHPAQALQTVALASV